MPPGLSDDGIGATWVAVALPIPSCNTRRLHTRAAISPSRTMLNFESELAIGMRTMSAMTAETQLHQGKHETYAYRRFGSGRGLPLLCLQHFTGTLDNWDPAVTDALASDRDVILFDSAGVGRSSGQVPATIAGMATYACDFLDALGLESCDVLGFSLGGMVAQQMAADRPSSIRRMVLVGTAPRGGQDIMHLDKPSLAKHLGDPTLTGYAVLQKLFFAPTDSSQAAGAAFVARLAQRPLHLDRASGADVAAAQLAAFRDWEQSKAVRFGELRDIQQPTLVVNGVHDEMIPVCNSYWLVENLPNAVLLVYPDSGHGSLFQFHRSFTRHVAAFLGSDSPFAPYRGAPLLGPQPDDASTKGNGHRLGSIPGAELFQDVFDVDLHGFMGNQQTLADVPVAIALAHVLEDCPLAVGQGLFAEVLDQIRRRVGGHVFLAGRGIPDDGGELLWRGVLQQVPLRPGGQRARDVGVAFEGRQDDDACIRELPTDGDQGLDARQLRQLQIHQCDIGPMGSKLLNRLEPGRRLRDHLHVRLTVDNGDDAIAHQRVVVDGEDANRRGLVSHGLLLEQSAR